MKPKLQLLSFFILFCINEGIAQVKQVQFFTQSGKEVKIRDSAYFIRTISEPTLGSVLYNVEETYANGKPKLTGKSYNIVEPLKYEGLVTRYYPSGIKKEEDNYKNSHLFGDVMAYYPNGKLYSVKKYPQDKAPETAEYLIISCNDSTGKVLAKDGNGYYRIYVNDFKTIKDEGPIKNGLKDGIWKGNNDNKNDFVTYTETYSNGKFISGESKDSQGKKYKYIDESLPQYVGGIQLFYNFLSQNVVYPEIARKNNITGKVYIKFIVEKDGSLTNIEVLRSPSLELANESLRVIKLSPKWIPGMEYGRPIRAQFVVPINFTLGEKN